MELVSGGWLCLLQSCTRCHLVQHSGVAFVFGDFVIYNSNVSLLLKGGGFFDWNNGIFI